MACEDNPPVDTELVPGESAVVAASSGMLVAALASQLGSPGAVVAAAIGPLATYGVTELISTLKTNSAARIDSVIGLTCKLSGKNWQELQEFIVKDEQRLLAFGQVVDAATRTTYTRKLGFLATVLANVVAEPRQVAVDEEMLYLKAVVDIEGPHVRVLHEIETGISGRDFLGDEGLSELEIANCVLPGAGRRALVRPIIQTLDRHVLIYSAALGSPLDAGRGDPRPGSVDDGSDHWALSEFGREFLDRLRESEE